MNSLSRTNCNGGAVSPITNGTTPVTCTCPPRFGVCPSQAADLHPLPCPALLECGRGFRARFTVSTPAGGTPTVTPTLPRDIASVNIDTTCLCFPNIKIEFSTLINYNTQGGGKTSGAVTLQLSRSCNNGTREFLTDWEIFLPTQPGNDNTTLPFSFVFCIENAPEANCTYFVEVTNVTIGTNPNAFANFENTNIAALAVGCAKVCR